MVESAKCKHCDGAGWGRKSVVAGFEMQRLFK